MKCRYCHPEPHTSKLCAGCGRAIAPGFNPHLIDDAGMAWHQGCRPTETSKPEPMAERDTEIVQSSSAVSARKIARTPPPE